MSLLRTLFAGIQTRFLRQVLVAVLGTDQVATSRYSFCREISRVGPHIGDVARFIKTLGQHHGFFNAEAHSSARCLLQRRGNVRRSRPSLCRLVFPTLDGESRRVQPRQGLLCFFLAGWPEIFSILFRDLEPNRLTVCRIFSQQRKNFPVFLRNERLDLALTFDNQFDRNGLNPTR